MLRIMWLSDKIFGGTSAFTKVTGECCSRLAKMGYPIAHTPISNANFMGKFSYEGVWIYPSGNDRMSEDVILSNALDFAADVIVTLKDVWTLNYIPYTAINWLPIVTVENSPVSSLITQKLKTGNSIRSIAITRFGQRELKAKGVESIFAPHGVRTDLYKQLNKKECRRMFGLDPEAFIIGIVARNQVRKMIPRMLRGIKLFVDRHPDVKIQVMLWTNIMPPSIPDPSIRGVADVAVNLFPEIQDLGLDPITVVPDAKLIEKGIPESFALLPERPPPGMDWDMVSLYNCFDVLLLCSGGEGFGLPLIEAQACGVPVITTDYAGGAELMGSGYLVPPSDYVILNTPGVRYALADLDKMADALTGVLNGDREKMGRRAISFARMYDWNRVMKEYFLPILDELEVELKPLVKDGKVMRWD